LECNTNSWASGDNANSKPDLEDECREIKKDELPSDSEGKGKELDKSEKSKEVSPDDKKARSRRWVPNKGSCGGGDDDGFGQEDAGSGESEERQAELGDSEEKHQGNKDEEDEQNQGKTDKDEHQGKKDEEESNEENELKEQREREKLAEGLTGFVQEDFDLISSEVWEMADDRKMEACKRLGNRMGLICEETDEEFHGDNEFSEDNDPGAHDNGPATHGNVPSIRGGMRHPREVYIERTGVLAAFIFADDAHRNAVEERRLATFHGVQASDLLDALIAEDYAIIQKRETEKAKTETGIGMEGTGAN
jgi:hypothetical protein